MLVSVPASVPVHMSLPLSLLRALSIALILAFSLMHLSVLSLYISLARAHALACLVCLFRFLSVCLRVEFSLKTESGYLRDAEVT